LFYANEKELELFCNGKKVPQWALPKNQVENQYHEEYQSIFGRFTKVENMNLFPIFKGFNFNEL